MRTLFFAVLLICIPFASYSVEPTEVLSDPVLEERARIISKDLRCLVIWETLEIEFLVKSQIN